VLDVFKQGDVNKHQLTNLNTSKHWNELYGDVLHSLLGTWGGFSSREERDPGGTVGKALTLEWEGHDSWSCSALSICLIDGFKKQSVTCSEMRRNMCLGKDREICFVLSCVVLLYSMIH